MTPRSKLAELDKLMGGNGESAPARPRADYDPDDAPVAPEPEDVRTQPAPPPPPGYDDLDQLLKRSGFHGVAQAELVSALVHRDVDGLAELSKAEVLITHDVVSKAIRWASTVGGRRAALSQLAAAERDAMESATAEAGLWADED